ncbi:MAG: Nif3-like dinuclear metal center hexameric protein [Clostridia bacterium]|nr:Nif3-like dinuclear metal center hexameric protein [Clostridia bacterium]
MNVSSVFNILNEYAPIKLSSELVALENGYDNSGIILPVTEDIKGVVFSLDLTVKAVERAIEEGANLIVTHHPAIYLPINKISENSAIFLCLKNKIGVISMHLNLDTCERGIDYYLAQGLNAKTQTILTPLSISNTGYGRLFSFNGTAGDLKSLYEKVFKTNKTVLYGNPNVQIKKVASFCGSGLNESEIEKGKDADIFISADIKHHIILELLEKGKLVLEVTHYSSEVYGFKKFYEFIATKLNEIKAVFYENEIML